MTLEEIMNTHKTNFSPVNPQKSKGLSNAEAKTRASKFDRNIIPRQQTHSFWKSLGILMNFFNVILVICAVCSLGVFLLDMKSNTRNVAVAIAFVVYGVIVNFSFYRMKANPTFFRSKLEFTLACSVIREGQTQKVSAAELVPGDIVHLQMGEVVPAATISMLILLTLLLLAH
jgi:magnesium-transporting ATPase (P-type)